MSSYQFVNTLAQCYAEQQNAAAAGTASGGHNQQDYYNMNYPNCYSPNLGNNYNQYSLMMSGQAAAAMASMASSAASTDTSTYANNTSLMAEGNSFGVTPKQEQRRSANSPMNNCANKYETGTVGGGRSVPPGGSPQDLRTSSENEGTPQPKSPSSPSAAGNQPPLSPLLSSTTSQVTSAAAAAAAVAAAAAAASSNTSSNSSNNVSNSGGGGGSGASGNRSSSNKQNSSNSTSSEDGKSSSGNPPQIYPWMKRAHLGQSEYLISKLLLRMCRKKEHMPQQYKGKNWCEQRERVRRGWI